MDTDTQLSKLRDRLGEPSDAAQARWTTAQLLSFLNDARNLIAEETSCFPVSDSQPTVAGTGTYSVGSDFIKFTDLEWKGLPLKIVRHEIWREVVGDDDTTRGAPEVCKYFARQIQIFPVPDSVETLTYHGYAYPTALVSGGVDASFTDYIADACIWQAVVLVKVSDERPLGPEVQLLDIKKKELKKQYLAKGARYVRGGNIYVRRWPIV